MIVEELIKLLRHSPPDAQVFVAIDGECGMLVEHVESKVTFDVAEKSHGVAYWDKFGDRIAVVIH